MRVISADALIMKQVSDGVYIVNREAILNAPTFDAEPLRHGHWEVVDVGTSFYKERKCSCCKQVIKSNYWEICPNCGAKMDEVSE